MSGEPEEPLRVDAAPVGPWARIERGPQGVRLVSVEAPGGVATAPGPTAAVRTLAPRKIQLAEVIADGKLVLAYGDDAAYSLRIPEMRVVHTRRPPGLDRVGGAALANAGLLHGDDGWRMVVLPSLGDVATDLGPGPIALRPDGRVLAVSIDGGVEEFDLTSGETLANHDLQTSAMAYGGDGALLVGAGGSVALPGAEPTPESPVAAIASATRAWRAVARHADGTLSVWDTEPESPSQLESWTLPTDEFTSITMSADGALIGVGTPHATSAMAMLLDAETGARVRHVEGARVISPLEGGQFVLGGDWGLAFLRPIEEKR